MPRYYVEITGWNSHGESVEDAGTFEAPTENEAYGDPDEPDNDKAPQ